MISLLSFPLFAVCGTACLALNMHHFAVDIPAAVNVLRMRVGGCTGVGLEVEIYISNGIF